MTGAGGPGHLSFLRENDEGMRRRVFICSPYAGGNGNIEENVAIARVLCRLAIKRGLAPFAPHLLYPGILQESKPKDRAAGISCGLKYMLACASVWAYGEHGVSSGMAQELRAAERMGKPVEWITDQMIQGWGGPTS